MCTCIGVCVLWGLSLAHHQRWTDLAPYGVCGGPLLRSPSTSARVQNGFEFVGLGGDMCSNCHRCHCNYSLVRQQARGTRHQVTGTIYERTAAYMYENIGYVQVPEHHLFATYCYHVSYEYMNTFPLWLNTYLWSYIQTTYVFGVDALFHYLLFFTLLMRVIDI